MKYAQLLKAIDSTSQHLLGHAAAVVNQALVIRNWLIGAYIIEFEQRGKNRAKYGERLLPRLAADLKEREIRGLSVQMLERTRQFYLVYPQVESKISSSLMRKSIAQPELMIPSSAMTEFSAGRPKQISAPVVRKFAASLVTPLSVDAVLCFSWTKLIELVRMDDPLKRAFYENECIKGNWSVRQLQRQIGSLLFERTGLSKNKAAVLRRAQGQEAPSQITDIIRDSYVLEFTGLAALPEYTESDLEQALLDHLQKFLLELGNGFCFEARQKRITVGNEHDYIDLVFYHRLLRCHVLIGLKTHAFTHGDAGQMNFYLNWWKKHAVAAGDQPPVDILLCSDKEQTKVEYATIGINNRVFVSRYLVALPSAEQLRRFVEKERAVIEAITEQRHPRRSPSSPTKRQGKWRPGN